MGDEHGQPIQFVDEQGNPVDYVPETAPVQFIPAQPSVFSCSPEIFAKLAQGGTLTQEELNSLTGAGPLAAIEEPPQVEVSPDAGNATSSSSKAKSKKKSLSKKKKSKSCC